MFFNYIKFAWRALISSRTYTAMTLFTLSAGLASCVLIVYYVNNELTFDHFHKNTNRIYRISTVMEFPGGQDHMAITPDLLGPYLKENFPIIEDYTRFEVFPAHTLKHHGQTIPLEGFSYVDRNVFEVFDYHFIAGNPNKALSDPSYITISKSIAQQYFGDPYNALNKTLEIDNHSFTITGVFKDLPDNTALPKHGLIGYIPAAFDTKAMWRFNHFTYLLLKNETDATKLTEVLQEVVKKTPSLTGMSFQTQALADLHFTTDIKQDVVKGNKNYVLGFGAVAFVLFCVVLFNYLNLSTVKAIERVKEVGLRKVIGARSIELAKQFLSEALLNLAIAGVFAFGLIQLLQPAFTAVTGKPLTFVWNNALPILLVALSGMIVIILLVSIYPAMMLASGKPANMLNKTLTIGSRGTRLRSFLMTAQFTLCSSVLISFFIIGAQFKYIQNFDLGFAREDIAGVSLPSDSVSLTKFRYLKEQLKKAGVQQVSFTSQAGNLLTGESFSDVVKINTETGPTELHVIPKDIDGEFIDVMRIPLVKGKSFKNYSWKQWSNLVIVNETFARNAGWENPLDKTIELPYGQGTITVIGVVKDFHVASLHNPIEPVMLRAWNFSEMEYTELMAAPRAEKLFLSASPATLPSIKKVWESVFPDHEFGYYFMDDAFEKQYEAESKTITLFTYFSLLAMTITGIGLYTLIAFQLSLRTKEIGIRKVMGANVVSLIQLLSRQTVTLVLAGSLLGLVLSWKVANWWLQSFTYKIEITGLLLLLPILFIILFGTILCVLRVVQATRANPIDALRSE